MRKERLSEGAYRRTIVRVVWAVTCLAVFIGVAADARATGPQSLSHQGITAGDASVSPTVGADPPAVGDPKPGDEPASPPTAKPKPKPRPAGAAGAPIKVRKAPSGSKVTPKPGEKGSPITIRPVPGQKGAVKQAGSAKKDKGCGSKPGVNAAPTPSQTGPHPKYVCQAPKCVLDPIWRGTDAVFTFTIGNEGEADLQIRLRGG